MAEVYMIQALKELPILKERIKKNRVLITQYASGVNTLIPDFKTEQEQRIQVKALVQSTMDLIDRYLKLKRNISYTNTVLEITIDEKTYTVGELITIRKEMKSEINATFSALNNSNGTIQLHRVATPGVDMSKISVVLYYDEAQKNKESEAWYNFGKKIDAELEIFNARTLLKDSKTGENYEDK